MSGLREDLVEENLIREKKGMKSYPVKWGALASHYKDPGSLLNNQDFNGKQGQWFPFDSKFFNFTQGLLYVAVGTENDDHHPSCFFVMLKADMTFIANPDTPKSLWKLRDSDLRSCWRFFCNVYSMMGHEHDRCFCWPFPSLTFWLFENPFE